MSEHLHQWIGRRDRCLNLSICSPPTSADLVFGALQCGEGARKAYNIFHPLTYEGAVDVDSIEDNVVRHATIAQISSYGQTPRQLFRRPHPEKVFCSGCVLSMNHLTALLMKMWKDPEPTVYSHPNQLWPYPLTVSSFAIHRIDMVEGQPIPQRPNKVNALQTSQYHPQRSYRCVLLQVLLYPEGTALVSWGYWDQNIRLCSTETGKVLLVIKTSHDEDVLCADITKDGQYLVTGGTSSLIKVRGRDLLRIFCDYWPIILGVLEGVEAKTGEAFQLAFQNAHPSGSHFIWSLS